MKKRLDQILVDKSLADSKTKAQALIMSGQVTVDGQISDKSGRMIPEDADVAVREAFPYVSRGASKLEKAYTEFGLDFEGKTVCDIGSSTGGFTDFALQHGASKVFAIDVGTGQLAQKIREDERVVVMEKTDFRDVFYLPSLSFRPNEVSGEISLDLSASARDDSIGASLDKKVHDEVKYITDGIDIFVCDVSFISLKQIIPKIAEITSSNVVIPAKAGIQKTSLRREAGSQTKSGMTGVGVDIILLIKPQFEAGAKEVTKGKGIIRDENLRAEIVEDIESFSRSEGFIVSGLVESPITGAKGNVEYLLYLNL